VLAGNNGVQAVRSEAGGVREHPVFIRDSTPVKIHCANPGAVIGAVDYNGVWNISIQSGAERERHLKYSS
jgi:hypothetical protein